MNIWDIAKSVGSSLIRELPMGGVILDTVNALLPDDKKLSANASGHDVSSAIQALPADQRAAVMEKQFDVDITEIKESHSTVRTMLESDAKNPHSTRPYIAKGAFLVVAFTIITVISIWAIGVLRDEAGLVKTVMDGWAFVLAVLAPLIVLLKAYFGVLENEHKNRLAAAGGNVAQPSGIAGIISARLKRGTGRKFPL